MQKARCKYLEKKVVANKHYYVFEDVEFLQQYIVPIEQVEGKQIQKGDIVEFHKIYNSKHRKYFLQNINISSFYQIDGIYEFSINSFGVYKDKNEEIRNTIEVLANDGTVINVSSSKWQALGIWNFPTIKCKVKGIRFDGRPVLVTCDDRHPFYEVGKSYDFKIIRKISKLNKLSNKKFEVFEILGDDNLQYEVPALPRQILGDELSSTINCEVISIDHNLGLSQRVVKDLYFVTIDNIIHDKTLVNKYFKPVFENDSNNSYAIKLKEQYSSGSAFWIFTYCNKILPQIFREYVGRFNYKCAFEINELILLFEEWIIKKGILQSFADEKIKSNSLAKASLQLEKVKIVKNVLQVILNSKSSFYYPDVENNLYKLDIQRLQYFLQFSNFKHINERFYVSKIIELTSNVVFDESELFFLHLLDRLINERKKLFRNGNTFEYFNLTENASNSFLNESNREKYFEWSFCHYHVNTCLGNSKKANYILAQLLREYFYSVDKINFKESLLFNSYFILNNYSVPEIAKPAIYSLEKGLTFNLEYNNPNSLNYQRNDWLEIHKSFKTFYPITVKVTKRTLGGFEIKYSSLKGFLPNNHISDNALRNSVMNDVDYSISACCILINEQFNTFIVRQLELNEDGYFSINNDVASIKVGQFYDGIVRKVESFGVFLNTKFGIALLHYSNISYHYWDFEKLNQFFKVDDKVTFVVLTIVENKIDVGIKQLKGSLYDDFYTNFVNRVESPQLDYLINDNDVNFEIESENLENEIQTEKAYCIEQYALIQNDFNDKINILRLAKQLYSSINSARSYLINIFTDYFQILLLVQEVINNYSFQNWKQVQYEVEKIKNKIDKKTVEIFPDSDKLIYFLDVISLFNEVSKEATEKLYCYVLEYSQDKSKKTLETIAKITLSNNLMISETKEDFDFSLKNLKIIYSYIRSGVFSLKENEEDRHQRELNELINYWKNKISQDEGQELEFKQTYLTPVLDTKRKKTLQEMESAEQTPLTKKNISRLIGEDAVKAIKHSALKSLAAFANTKGGTLLLGVSDNKKVTGLEIDYSKLKQENRDGFGKKFDEDIKTYLGESFSSLLDKKFLKFPEGDVLIIEVQQAVNIVFLMKDEQGNNSEDVYIRHLSSTVLLTGKELLKFFNLRHKRVGYSE